MEPGNDIEPVPETPAVIHDRRVIIALAHSCIVATMALGFSAYLFLTQSTTGMAERVTVLGERVELGHRDREVYRYDLDSLGVRLDSLIEWRRGLGEE